MAKQFLITAQLNVKPPPMGQVIAHIQRSLSGIRSGINIKLTGTSSKQIATYAANVSKLNKALSQLTPTAAAAGQAIGSIPALNLNITSASVRNLSNYSVAVKGLTASLNRLTPALNQITPAAGSAAQALSQLGAAITTFNSARNNFNSRASNFTVQLNNGAKAAKSTSVNIRHATSDLEAFGTQAALASRRFLAFSLVAGPIVGLTVGIKSAVSEAINFETEMTKVAQVAGTTVAKLQPLADTISNLSTTFGVSSKEMIGIASTLAQANVTLEELPSALKTLSLTQLAPTFGDITNTVEGFIALRGQFGTSVNDMEAAMGGLNAVSAKYAVESDDLITAIRKAGGAFRATGADISDLLGLFTAVRATSRESAETIAVALRTITTRLQRGSTNDFLKNFGIDIRDSEGRFVGVFESIRRIQVGIQKFDPKGVEIPAIAEEVAGNRNLSRFFSLLQNFNIAEQARDVSKGGADSLAKNAELALKTLSNQLVKTKEEFLQLFRTIVSSDSFQLMARSALSLAVGIAKVSESLTEMLPLITAVVGMKALASVGPVLGGFIGGIRRVRNGGLTPPANLNFATPNRRGNVRQSGNIASPLLSNPNVPGFVNRAASQFFTTSGPNSRAVGRFNPNTSQTIDRNALSGMSRNQRRVFGAELNSFLRDSLASARPDLVSAGGGLFDRRRTRLSASAFDAISNGTLQVSRNQAGGIAGVGGFGRGALGSAGLAAQRRFSISRAGVIGRAALPLAALGAGIAATQGGDVIDEQGRRNNSGIAGRAVIGGLSGAAIGSLAGPVGAVIGGTITGLIALRMALKESAEKIIQFTTDKIVKQNQQDRSNFGPGSEQSGNSLINAQKNADKLFTEAVFRERTLGERFADPGSSLSILKTSIFDGKPAADKELSDLLAKDQAAREELARSAARDSVPGATSELEAFQKKAGDDVNKFVELLATPAGVAAERILYLADANNQLVNNMKKTIEAMSIEEAARRRNISQWDIHTDSLKRNADAITSLSFLAERAQRELAPSSIAFGGNGDFRVERASEILARPTDPLFDQTLRERGITDQKFFDVGILARDFKDIINKTFSEQGTEVNGFDDKLIDNLLKGGVRSNAITDKLQDFAAGLIKEVEEGQDFGPDVKDTMRDKLLGFFDDMAKDLSVTRGNIEQEGDRFIANLSQLADQTKRIRDEQDKLAGLGLQANRARRAIQADRQDRTLPVDVTGEATAISNSIRRLTGGTLDAATIANRGIDARSELTAIEVNRLQPDDPGFVAARERAEVLKGIINDTGEALNRLTDTATNTAAAEERLGQIASEEAGRRSFVSGFFGGGIQDRIGKAQDLRAAKFASDNLGNFENLPIMIQNAAIRGFQSLGDVGVFNGRTGNEEISRLAKQVFGGDPEAVNEKDRLQRAILQAHEQAVTAQQELIRFLGANNTSFITQLSIQMDNFLLRLGDQGKGKAPGFASGGMFSGKKGRDQNLIWASDGEFIVNPQQSKKHRALLEAINSGKSVKGFANGGLNGSQQMARDMQEWVRETRKPIDDFQEGLKMARASAARDTTPGFGRALLDGAKAVGRDLSGGLPKFSEPGRNGYKDFAKAITDGAATTIGANKPNYLNEFDAEQARMAADPGFLYQKTGRIRIPSPYSKPRAQYTDSMKASAVADAVKNIEWETQEEKRSAEQIRKLDEIKQAVLDFNKNDKTVATTVAKQVDKIVTNNNTVKMKAGGNASAVVSVAVNAMAAQSGMTDMASSQVEEGIRRPIGNPWKHHGRPPLPSGQGLPDSRFRRRRAAAYGRKVRAGKINPRDISYEDYVFGPEQGDAEGMIGGNTALGRGARRHRMGVPFWTDREENRRKHRNPDSPKGLPVPLPDWKAPWNRPEGHANPHGGDVLIGGAGGDMMAGGMARSQEQLASSVNSLVQFNTDFTANAKHLADAMMEFNRVAPELARALNDFTMFIKDNPIPSSLTMTGSLTHDVNMNGAEVLSEVGPGLVRLADKAVKDGFAKQYRQGLNGSSSPEQIILRERYT